MRFLFVRPLGIGSAFDLCGTNWDAMQMVATFFYMPSQKKANQMIKTLNVLRSVKVISRNRRECKRFNGVFKVLKCTIWFCGMTFKFKCTQGRHLFYFPFSACAFPPISAAPKPEPVHGWNLIGLGLDLLYAFSPLICHHQFKNCLHARFYWALRDDGAKVLRNRLQQRKRAFPMGNPTSSVRVSKLKSKKPIGRKYNGVVGGTRQRGSPGRDLRKIMEIGCKEIWPLVLSAGTTGWSK